MSEESRAVSELEETFMSDLTALEERLAIMQIKFQELDKQRQLDHAKIQELTTKLNSLETNKRSPNISGKAAVNFYILSLIFIHLF
jgi:hypothetical protein